MGLFDKLSGVLGGKGKLDIAKRFELNRHPFHGTMSKFHVATEIKTGKAYGIKLLDEEKTRHFRERFKGLDAPTEGEIGMQLEHPLIAKTYEFGRTVKGQEYILMELMDGPGVNTLLADRNEKLLGPNRVSLILQMATALQALHEAGFIHRDICPRNFICSKDVTKVKLIDFGLSVPDKEEFKRPGNRTGTPQYMSPEVVRRRPTDQRLDLFSFGVTMYKMLTYEHPWGSTDTTGVGALHHDQRPATDIREFRPNLHELLVEAVHKCLEIVKEDRMPSAKRLLQFIKRVKTEER